MNPIKDSGLPPGQHSVINHLVTPPPVLGKELVMQIDQMASEKARLANIPAQRSGCFQTEAIG